jgi:2-C-methyl-D-erythritol 4-phosphate cytidylyltransferase
VSVAAILLCAGRGQRLGIGVDKALAPLAGRPLFAWSLEVLQGCVAIESIVVVGPSQPLREALSASGHPPTRIVAWVEGGKERRESVARGLAALPAAPTLVVIHDSARALVSAALVAQVIADALEHGASIAALPLSDTLKRGRLKVVEDTVPRAGLWCAQTPQAFRRDWIEDAHRRIAGEATDDSVLVEAAGHRVRLTPGDPLNFKVTTPRDLELAEAWLTRAPSRT